MSDDANYNQNEFESIATDDATIAGNVVYQTSQTSFATALSDAGTDGTVFVTADETLSAGDWSNNAANGQTVIFVGGQITMSRDRVVNDDYTVINPDIIGDNSSDGQGEILQIQGDRAVCIGGTIENQADSVAYISDGNNGRVIGLRAIVGGSNDNGIDLLNSSNSVVNSCVADNGIGSQSGNEIGTNAIV